MDDAALTVAGDPGHRVALSAQGSEMTEHAGCGWIILRPVRAWEEWRQFARMILATVDPGDG